MSHAKLFSVALMIFLASSSASVAQKKYDSAMLFSGGGMQTAVFLGMYEAAIEAGKKPDVIVATCGGSIAAAIVSRFGSPDEMRVYLKSDEFYDGLKTIQLTDETKLVSLVKLILDIRKSKPGTDRNFLKDYILDIPQDFAAPSLARPFSSDAPVVFVASKVEGAQFKETFFTNPETGALLAGFRSPLAGGAPASRVMEETEVRSDVDMVTALRASISDPFLMKPKSIGPDVYLGGVVDLYTLEAAHALADHVIASYSVEPSHSVFAPAVQDVFGFNVYDRLRSIQGHGADYWVDFSDYEEMGKKYGFDPVLDLGKLFEGKSDHGIQIMKSRIPATKAQYESAVDYLWEVGRRRMQDTLAYPLGDLTHIRKMEKFNTSPEVRKLRKQQIRCEARSPTADCFK